MQQVQTRVARVHRLSHARGGVPLAGGQLAGEEEVVHAARRSRARAPGARVNRAGRSSAEGGKRRREEDEEIGTGKGIGQGSHLGRRVDDVVIDKDIVTKRKQCVTKILSRVKKTWTWR